ncbi:MAG: hypothetical protein AAF401_07030 [Pseudomonadota bacterium]
MAASKRRGAYSSAMLTLAVFLSPALLAPGPVEAANIAGVALAIWLAVDAWRVYGRRDLKATLPYRIAPVSPGLLGAAALIFLISILHGWVAWNGIQSSGFVEIADLCLDYWDFPFSPVAMYAKSLRGLPDMSLESIRAIALCLSAAVWLGLVFGLAALFGRIQDRPTLRRHALLWKGVDLTSGEDRLAARGSSGLRPVRDPFSEVRRTPISGRLMIRAVSMIVAIITLPYAPLFIRFVSGSGIPQVEAFFASPFADNLFFMVWLTALWALLVAGAIIFFFAYLRLALTLRLK